MDEFDVVVLGTGAAGLTAAIRASAEGATVGLFEKLDRIGGTAAWSGGMAWIPGNPHMAAVGATDSREDALTYLASLSNGMIDSSAAETFVDRGPEVVRWLEANTPVKFFVIAGFPRLSPGEPGREVPGRPDDGMPAVRLQRARRMVRPRHQGTAALRCADDHGDSPRPRSARGESSRGTGQAPGTR